MNRPTFDSEKQAWIFPDGWTAEQRDAWDAINGERIHHEKRAELAAKALVQATESPDALLAAAREATGAAKREADAADRRTAGELAWRKAHESHDADMLERIDTVEGDVVILRTMTLREISEAEMRAAKLLAAAQNERQAVTDQIGAHNDALAQTVLHPDLPRLKALIEKRPGLLKDMYAARDRLTKARADAEGKGFAP